MAFYKPPRSESKANIMLKLKDLSFAILYEISHLIIECVLKGQMVTLFKYFILCGVRSARFIIISVAFYFLSNNDFFPDEATVILRPWALSNCYIWDGLFSVVLWGWFNIVLRK